MSAFLVRTHKTRVARHISGENGGQPPFDAFRSQSGAPQPHGPNRSSALGTHSIGKRKGWHSLSLRRAISFSSIRLSASSGPSVRRASLSRDRLGLARYCRGLQGIAVTEILMTSLRPQRVASIRSSTRSPGLGLLAIVLALSCAACGQSPMVLTAYRTEQQAQEHCPSDIVVWVDPQSGTYYLKRSASYGRAGLGRYPAAARRKAPACVRRRTERDQPPDGAETWGDVDNAAETGSAARHSS